jgi:YVTN family beta-propeller protein
MFVRRLIAACLIVGCGAIARRSTPAPVVDHLGPVAVAASRHGKVLFVANARRISVVSTAHRRVVTSVEMPFAPTAVALSTEGKRLYVACAAPKSVVCELDAVSYRVLRSLPAGHTASGLALSPDGKRLYVCNRFNNDVSVIDLESGKETARVPAVREPLGTAVTPDGRSVFVINHLPLDRADSGEVAAAVTVIDAATAEQGEGSNGSHTVATTIRLINGSSSVRGISISPDGRHVYVAHILSRFQAPTTQLDRGWMNTNALSIIDARAKKLLDTVLLDEVDLGAANPSGVALTADGRQICVTHAGTSELSVIDATGLLDRLTKLAATSDAGEPKKLDRYEAPASLTPADVPNDLAFLLGLRHRVHLQGVGPRGIIIVGSTAYVPEYFTDTLDAVDLAAQPPTPVAHIALGPTPKLSLASRGQMLFESADLCFQKWQSCGSCHPDARADGLNWDLLNDGIGNPKNTRSMLLTQQGGPAMALGVRENAQSAVRAGILHIQFAVRPEEDAQAIDAYLAALRPVPSPYLLNGRLSSAAERGKKIFFDGKVGCARCHPEPMYSDRKAYDVGSNGQYDRPTDKFYTPSLLETWRTAPYMHDGHYLTIKELIVQGKHGGKDGELNGLTEQQIDDLVTFVLSL